MSNSAKQREFFKNAIELIKRLGCDVVVEKNKHYKAKISLNGKCGTWGVSSTPSNRFSAQRAALSDLKRILREIGIDFSNQDFSVGMLHLITNHSNATVIQQLDALIEKEITMNLNIFKDLLNHSYPNLTPENLNEILHIFETIQNISNWDSHSRILPNPLGGKSGPATVKSTPNWAILDKNGNPNTACMRNVITLTSDLSNRFPLKWQDAFSLQVGLDNLIDYYGKCQGITKLGVLITNVWRPGELFSFDQKIEHFEGKGIQSLALLISGHSVLPTPWPWR